MRFTAHTLIIVNIVYFFWRAEQDYPTKTPKGAIIVGCILVFESKKRCKGGVSFGRGASRLVSIGGKTSNNWDVYP